MIMNDDLTVDNQSFCIKMAYISFRDLYLQKINVNTFISWYFLFECITTPSLLVWRCTTKFEERRRLSTFEHILLFHSSLYVYLCNVSITGLNIFVYNACEYHHQQLSGYGVNAIMAAGAWPCIYLTKTCFSVHEQLLRKKCLGWPYKYEIRKYDPGFSSMTRSQCIPDQLSS